MRRKVVSMNYPKKISIKVPASTGNVGSGFDCVGMAMDIWNEIEVSFNAQNLTIENQGIDVEKYQQISPEDNFIIQGIRAIDPDVDINKIRVINNNRIPFSIGLGSSAAALCAGLSIGNLLTDKKINEEELTAKAINIEGHPDNASPCFYGGLTISSFDQSEKRWITRKIDLPEDLNVVIFVPNFTSATRESRVQLPSKIERRDVVYNLSRVALLIDCFINKDFALLKHATQDSIHQDVRFKNFPEMKSVLNAAINAGALGAILSGSGPAIMAFSQGNEFTINYEMEESARKHNIEGNIILTRPSNKGVTIT